MANTSAGILGDGATQAAVLAQRRCIILAIVGATPTSNSALESILQAGFLSAVKTWLDDILNGTVGEFIVLRPLVLPASIFWSPTNPSCYLVSCRGG